MLRFLMVYLLLVVIDAVWLTVIAQPLFTKYLPGLLTSHSLTVPAALLTWLILLAGVKFFVMPLCPPSLSRLMVYWYGALFGGCVYGVYELTNFAVIKGWSLQVVAVDTLWGAVLCGLMAVLLHL